MFKSWGTWLGIESTLGQQTDGIQAEETCGSEKDTEKISAVNKQQCSDNSVEEIQENQPILQQAKGLSG